MNNDGVIDIPGYGYKAVKNWEKQGFSDIDVLLRYQYYNSENWRLAATGGVRLPTGWTHNRDSLVDYPSGSGAWVGLLRLNQDYIGTKDLFLTATLKYDYYFPDRNYERVPDSVDQPLTTNKERVHRTIGPYFALEMTGAYNLWIMRRLPVMDLLRAVLSQTVGKVLQKTPEGGIVDKEYSLVPNLQPSFCR